MQVRIKATVNDLAHVQPLIDGLNKLGHVSEADITIDPSKLPGSVVTPEQIKKLEEQTANLKAARGTLETAIAGADQPKT